MARQSAARCLGAAAASASLLVALAPSPASADAPPACDGWEVEYTLASRVQVSDTAMGAGDGTYDAGPGRLVLRFEDRGGQPGGRVRMTKLAMHHHFSVVARMVFTTTVTTDADAQAACPTLADGTLNDHTLAWSGNVCGYRSDGTLTCEGSMCGKFGAPPSGQSPFHMGPDAVTFKSLEFAPDMKTFKMPFSLVSQSESPKQKTALALSGREVRRTCIPPAPPAPVR
jgi:hypothetical protein